MKTDKIAEVLESETRFWNMRESDIRGRAVLDYDALKLITDKLNTLTLAQEQLDDIISEADRTVEGATDFAQDWFDAATSIESLQHSAEEIVAEMADDISRFAKDYHADQCAACGCGGAS